jgi:hypothetical protein
MVLRYKYCGLKRATQKVIVFIYFIELLIEANVAQEIKTGIS